MEIISKNSYYYDFNQQEKRKALYTENTHTEMWMANKQIYSHDTLNEFLKRQTERRNSLEKRRTQPRHYNTDFLFEEVSKELVKCKVMILTTWQDDNDRNPRLIHSGICDFEFTKTKHGWLISRRVLYIDHKLPPSNIQNI